MIGQTFVSQLRSTEAMQSNCTSTVYIVRGVGKGRMDFAYSEIQFESPQSMAAW